MKRFMVLCSLLFVFIAASYGQDEKKRSVQGSTSFQAIATAVTESLAVVLVDFSEGRVQPGDVIPTQDSQLDLVASINSVGGMGWVYEAGQWKKRVRKYVYDDYWDWIFSDSPVWTGTRHPDYTSHGSTMTTYGSIKDYFKEVSYNNLTITPAKTWVGTPNKYNTGIINTVDIVNGKKYIRWIMMPNAKSTYYEGQSNGPLTEIIDELRNQKNAGAINFDVDTYLANGGKLLIISAGSAGGGVAQLGGQLLSVREKMYDNSEPSSTLDGIALIVHEYGHTLGFTHLAASAYDPMNVGMDPFNAPEMQFSPPHFNPIYKMQKGWLTTGDALKITSATGTMSLPPITSQSKKIGLITVYGDAWRNGKWDHSEYFVLEYRKREKFNRFIGGVNASFGNDSGGVLIWHQSKYEEYYFYSKIGIESNATGLKALNYTTDPNDNLTQFGRAVANPSHFYYSAHSLINQSTNPNTNSGVHLATGISLSNFSVTNGQMSLSINDSLGAVPIYSNFHGDGIILPNSIAGNTYIEGSCTKSSLTLGDPSHVDFAPRGTLSADFLSANSGLVNGMVFEGAGFGGSKNRWEGIYLYNNSSQASIIGRCKIYDARVGVSIYIEASDLEPTIGSNQFQNCTTDLYFYNFSTTYKNIKASSNSFSSNGNIKILGKWNITSSFTAPSGTTLNIIPFIDGVDDFATALQFSSGANLYCYGKLNAAGTSSLPVTFSRNGSSGSWSIVLSGSGANSSTLNYVNLQNGGSVQVSGASNIVIDHSTMQNCTGISVINSASNITLQNSTLTGCTNGISFTGTAGSVLNNTISYISNNGITVLNGATVTSNVNKIKNCSQGIVYSDGSHGNIGGNDIAYCSNGIYIANSSNPRFRNTPFAFSRNNRMTNCWWGLSIYSSFPTMYDGQYCHGLNTIYDNDDVDLGYVNGGGYVLDAIGVYWKNGNPANASIQQAPPNSTVITSPYCTTDPWAGVPLPKQSGNGLNPAIADPLRDGLWFRGDDKFREAKDFFVSYLKENPDDRRAYIELYNCYSKETADEITRYFKTLSNSEKELKLLLGYLYLNQGDVISAKGVNNTIMSDNTNTVFAAKAKLNNFYIALYSENNPDAASLILNDISSNPEFSNPKEISYAQFALQTYVKVDASETQPATPEQTINKQIPESFSLLQNYPNPFNPSTTINYQLKTVGHVTLKVYDVLGREVANLVNGTKDAGTYTVQFDGSSLASGIYFTRFTAQPQNGSQPFVQVRKMLMLK